MNGLEQQVTCGDPSSAVKRNVYSKYSKFKIKVIFIEDL